MANLLLIETSSSTCSVALSSDNQIICSFAYSDGMKHAEKLPVFIEQCLKHAKTNGLTINAIAVSGGPGSYTGLRIGVSHAKGLCYGMNIPLIAIDSLEIIASKAANITKDDYQIIIPMVDARRMEVYCCAFNQKYDVITAHQATIIDNTSFQTLLDQNKVLFCGDGANKCTDTITHPNALFSENFSLIADDMLHIVTEKYKTKNFANLAYYEPFYLKEYYVATK